MRSGNQMTDGRLGRERAGIGRLLLWLLPVALAAGPCPARADSEIFVVGSGVFDVFPRTADGNAAPIRKLPGSGAGGVAVDTINHEVFVTDFSNHAIYVYARTANGKVAPIRTLKGAATQLNNPFGLFVDTTHNELIVAEGSDDKVLVFPRTANGNVAPIRTVENHTQTDPSGFFSPIAVFVDLVHDELVVCVTKLATEAILTFPRLTNGTAVLPVREFPGGPNVGLEGMFVNTDTDEIFVVSTVVDGEIRVYPRTLNSPINTIVFNSVPGIPPTRTIKGAATGLQKPVGLGVDLANGEVIVSVLNNSSVRTFPLSGSGNIAPVRTISGAATGLAGLAMMALGEIPSGLPAALVAAVLPASRSVRTGTAATAFATMINTGSTPLSNCEIAQLTGPPTSQLGYTFQTTDPATNQVVGSPSAPVTIPGNSAQTFVFAFTPAAAFAPTDIQLGFQCAGSALAPIITGLDTFLLSASATAIPDVVALVATVGNNGIVDISSPSGAGAFAVATVNVGASALITAVVDTGSATIPVTLTVCQTDPITGQCTSAIGASVTTQIDAGQTPTFAVFAAAQGIVPFDPANNRVFVRFKDQSGAVRGATSVAARTL